MKVLVTGGAGYIGSHACKALARAGHEPVAYDDLSFGHRWAVRWGPLVVGDVADRERLAETIRKYNVDAVMHFSGCAYVGESMQDPLKYFRANTAGSLAVLEAMLQRGVHQFVFSSTCAVYGAPEYLPLDEAHGLAPTNPYGESKLAVEKALRWAGGLKGLRWMALRYFNAAGADPEGEIGEAHDPETHLIPLALNAAAPGDYCLRVFGADYPTPDGTAIRDYVHVSDLAHAHVLALDALGNGMANEAINLGAGRGASVKEVITAVERVTGLEVRREESPRRPGDPPELVANPEKARVRLGWTAKRSDLDTIVADAWRWHQKKK